MAKYHIYTDGSSRGNPGPGGWGMLVMDDEESKIICAESNYESAVTNNRMELKALICALGYAESHPNDYFIIRSDSAYVVNAYNSWLQGWAANGWRNSKKQTVENLDLMQALHYFIKKEFFNAEVRKCDGHTGQVGNELADALATASTSKFESLIEYWNLTVSSEKAGENWYPID
jgi:ribonuclease HI